MFAIKPKYQHSCQLRKTTVETFLSFFHQAQVKISRHSCWTWRWYFTWSLSSTRDDQPLTPHDSFCDFSVMFGNFWWFCKLLVIFVRLKTYCMDSALFACIAYFYNSVRNQSNVSFVVWIYIGENFFICRKTSFWIKMMNKTDYSQLTSHGSHQQIGE